jgi:hypothetical protein
MMSSSHRDLRGFIVTEIYSKLIIENVSLAGQHLCFSLTQKVM